MKLKFKLSSLLLISGFLFLVGCDQQVKNTQMAQPAVQAQNPCTMHKGMTMNPCSPVAKGKALWSDASLGTSGKACTTCHMGGAMLKLDKAFPHRVEMVNKTVELKDMINFCITNPLAGKAIDPDGPKMEAMVAYYNHMAVHMGGNPCGMKHHNPCHMKNPCGMKHHNPCDMKNPCGMKHNNPCAMKNPCAAKNPCGMKNPCNM